VNGRVTEEQWLWRGSRRVCERFRFRSQLTSGAAPGAASAGANADGSSSCNHLATSSLERVKTSSPSMWMPTSPMPPFFVRQILPTQ
jgi:hypothetical protein